LNTRRVTKKQNSAIWLKLKVRAWIMIFCVIGLVPARSEPTQASGPEAKLRVLTYNVFVGFKDDTKRHAQAVGWIAAQHPDVVALQELNEYTEAKLSEDARAWGHPYSKLCVTQSGYHLGLTSRKPLENVHLIVKKGICHGMIHGQTHGIDFFVLHLAPQSEEIRIPETELVLAEIRGIQSPERPTILLGDFNSSSPLDADYFRHESKHHPKFNVMTRYLDAGYVDLVQQHQGVLTEKQASAPTSLIKKDQGFWRLDYILASAPLAKRCVAANVVKGKETHLLSDHYPVIADFACP
jgi:endonuclease/exonuclease/phosphatase family metal-dependent hydrolase